MKVVVASRNSGKVFELEKIFEPLGWTFLPLSLFDCPTIEETGHTFEENAIIKARTASKFTGLPAIADDSGLEVDHLSGGPGVRSARFSNSGEDLDNNLKLLQEMLGVPNERRTARYSCALAFISKYDEPSPIVCSANWEGRILEKPAGNGGFGYDPLFFVSSHNCSAAQLTTEEKNRISHRSKASSLMLVELKRVF